MRYPSDVPWHLRCRRTRAPCPSCRTCRGPPHPPNPEKSLHPAFSPTETLALSYHSQGIPLCRLLLSLPRPPCPKDEALSPHLRDSPTAGAYTPPSLQTKKQQANRGCCPILYLYRIFPNFPSAPPEPPLRRVSLYRIHDMYAFLCLTHRHTPPQSCPRTPSLLNKYFYTKTRSPAYREY